MPGTLTKTIMMKSIIFLLLFTPVMITAPFSLEKIANAISNGDAKTLASFFDEDIEMTVLDEINLYSKTEGQSAVKDFFTKNPPKKYTQVHQGASQGAGGQYCIGVLETTAQKYRVMIYLEKVGETFLIKELIFEKE